jgi:hypothetical protein
MTAIEVIRTAMAMSEKSTMSLIEDMRDAPLTQPTSRGGNHPLWVLGHITYYYSAKSSPNSTEAVR